jgi:DNA invertase Pin-like site-specific DNA recombinase
MLDALPELMISKNMRAVIYHRVSTAEQDATLARHELRAAAASRGLTVVAEVEETGSGARNDRPGLQQVMESVRRGRADVVVVWKLDRFGRSALDLLANIEELERCGARFIATTQGIDIRPDGDPMSRLILVVLAGVAQFERSIIIERTRLGLAKARRQGKSIGRPRKGRAPEAEAVAGLRALGRSWAEIASDLGCTMSAARRACQTGPQNVTVQVSESRSA